MNALFLTCALALPANDAARFRWLRDFIENRYPDYMPVLIHKDEAPVLKFKDQYLETPFQVEGLRLWIKKSA